MMKQKVSRKTVSIGYFHAAILQDVFEQPVSDDDAMLLFALLHLCETHVPKGVIQGNPECTCIAALTQRHAGETVGAIWKGTDDERRSYAYWYWKWNSGEYGNWQSLADLPPRALELKMKVETHPFVLKLAEEDLPKQR